MLELVRAIGLRPIDVGPLVRARQLEAMAFLNMALNIVNQGNWNVRLEALRREHPPAPSAEGQP